jgi:uncharacterized protein YkwD
MHISPPTKPVRKRRSSGFWRTVRIGLILMPLVFGLTFCGLVFSTQAMFGDQLPRLQTVDPLEPLQALLFPTSSVVSLNPTPAYTQISAVQPSQTLVVYQPTDTPAPLITLNVPSSSPTWPTPTETHTLTPTDTPTPSMTASETGTSTNTFTNTPTASLTWTLRPSSTFTRTPSRTPQATTPPPPTGTPSSTEFEPTTSVSVTSPPASPTIEPTSSSCDAIGNSAYEEQLLQFINDERSQAGVPPLAMQSQLRAAARVHSTDMACNNFISHTGSDGSRPADRVQDQGYSFSWIGENIFSTSNTSNAPLQAITWWMNSTPHRNNILSPNYTEIGLGYIYNADSSYSGYFTAVFARP